MKRLSILRHAKSRWSETHSDDFVRPLNKRGRASAPIMADFLNDHLGAPDFTVCSAAKRTRETLDLMLPCFRRQPEIKISRDLYLASPDTILGHIAAVGEHASHILVIAHNPGLHMLALDLADPARSQASDIRRLAKKFPTAALAVYEFDLPKWNVPLIKKGALRFFVSPKELRAKS